MEHDSDNNVENQELNDFKLESNALFDIEGDHEAYYVYKNEQL